MPLTTDQQSDLRAYAARLEQSRLAARPYRHRTRDDSGAPVAELPGWRAIERRLAELDEIDSLMRQAPSDSRKSRAWASRDMRGWRYRNGARTRAATPSDIVLAPYPPTAPRDRRTW